MKIFNLIKLSFDDFINNFKKSILIVTVFTIGLTLISFSMMAYNGSNESYKSLNDNISGGIKNAGIIRFKNNDFYSEDGKNFLDEVYNKSEIKNIGFCFYVGSDSFEELEQIQYGHAIDSGYTQYHTLEVLVMSRTLLGFSKNINIKSGIPLSDVSCKDFTPLYLGSAYAGKIPINKEFKDKSGKTYKVIGFLNKGAECLDPSIVDGLSMQQVNYGESLDYAVIEVDDTCPQSNAIVFSVRSGCNMNNGITQIKKVADKYNLPISIEPLEQIYKSQKGNTELLEEYLKQIMIMVLCAVCIIIICLKTVMIISEKRVYGIYYSLGFNHNNIYVITLVESFVESVLALLFTMINSCIIARWWFNLENLSYIYENVFIIKVFPVLMIITFAEAVLISLIPSMIIRKNNPYKLIGEQEND
jgi:hypothetical protein